MCDRQADCSNQSRYCPDASHYTVNKRAVFSITCLFIVAMRQPYQLLKCETRNCDEIHQFVIWNCVITENIILKPGQIEKQKLI